MGSLVDRQIDRQGRQTDRHQEKHLNYRRNWDKMPNETKIKCEIQQKRYSQIYDWQAICWQGSNVRFNC